MIQLLRQLILLLGIVGVTALDILDLRSQPGHTHHAFLGFGVNWGEHQLNRQRKNNHRDTVVLGGVVEHSHQPSKGHGDYVG